MKYENCKELKETDFKRLVGIEKKTFIKMVEILKEAEKIKKSKGGKPNKTIIEDRLLMAFEYWREYRTFFHIATNHGISESQCFRNTTYFLPYTFPNKPLNQSLSIAFRLDLNICIHGPFIQ